MNAGTAIAGSPSLRLEALLLLVDDRELVLERPRVVRPGLRPEAILERA